MLREEIKQMAKEIHQEVIGNRRHLHANPELSFREYETAAFVKARLTEMGLSWESVTETGVVAMIHGERPSDQVIALRADMDALPITEKNEISYVSQNPSVMHACGHDAHTSSLLGTAFILQSLKSQFGGVIKLIFQPGEETLPGGASLMIKEGVLEGRKPAAVIGQHCMPSISTGKIGIRKGLFMASMDEIRVTVKGKGGHGAMPHHNVDPVLISAQLIVALQQVVSRFANPTTPTVLSFGKVIANGAINVIPDEVTMEGTFRTFDETWRTEAHAHMKSMAEGIAASLGGSCDFTIVRGYPALINEEALTDQIYDLAAEYIGRENIVTLDPWMAAEDFAYYSQAVDSCFYLLGTGNTEKNTTSFLHTPTFNIDEDALAISTGLMAYMAVKRLGN
jgi:amidohydrolase